MMIAGYMGGVSQMSSQFGGKEIAVPQIHQTIFVPLGVPILVPVGIVGLSLGIMLGCIGFLINLTRNTRKHD